MTKVFVKQEELSLVNGGYLVSGKDSTPVSNEEFVIAQKHAEYIISLAAATKGKDFVGKAPENLADIVSKVKEALYNKNITEFVKKPAKVKFPIGDQLKAEALAFIKGKTDSSNVDAINDFLIQFEVINEFEEFGLFFNQDIVKLNRIYTMKEIIDAVKAVINLI